MPHTHSETLEAFASAGDFEKVFELRQEKLGSAYRSNLCGQDIPEARWNDQALGTPGIFHDLS